MAGSLLERLQNLIRDSFVDFLEIEPQSEPASLETMSPSEISSRLKLRLGTLEAQRYRLREALSDAPSGDFDARAGAAVDAGDDRLAREILRHKVEHISTRAEAETALEDLDGEAEDLQRLIAMIDADEDVDLSLDDRLAKYEAIIASPEHDKKEG